MIIFVFLFMMSKVLSVLLRVQLLNSLILEDDHDDIVQLA